MKEYIITHMILEATNYQSYFISKTIPPSNFYLHAILTTTTGICYKCYYGVNFYGARLILL